MPDLLLLLAPEIASAVPAREALFMAQSGVWWRAFAPLGGRVARTASRGYTRAVQPPPVGSLVVPSPRYRDTLATGEGAALLLGLRRGSGRLFYAGADKGYWVPTGELRAIPAEAVPEGCLERFLSGLLLFLRAEECSIDEYGEGLMEIGVEAPDLDAERHAELRERWAGHLDRLDFAPRNMSRILLRLRLSRLPEPAETGT
jgi:hypothetical protein